VALDDSRQHAGPLSVLSAELRLTDVGPRYDVAAADIAARLSEHGLQQVLFNLPAGNWDAGERGLACLPDRVDEFRSGVSRAIEYEQVLGVKQLNSLAGRPPQGASSERFQKTLIENL
jgi:hydroxypyruvate isomerase